MAISFCCPMCGHTYQVRDEMAGKRARCRCGQVLSVPDSMMEPNLPDEINAGLTSLLQSEETRLAMDSASSQPIAHLHAMRPRKKKKPAKNNSIMIAGIGAVAVATLFMVFLIVVLSGRSKNDLAGREVLNAPPDNRSLSTDQPPRAPHTPAANSWEKSQSLLKFLLDDNEWQFCVQMTFDSTSKAPRIRDTDSAEREEIRAETDRIFQSDTTTLDKMVAVAELDAPWQEAICFAHRGSESESLMRTVATEFGASDKRKNETISNPTPKFLYRSEITVEWYCYGPIQLAVADGYVFVRIDGPQWRKLSGSE